MQKGFSRQIIFIVVSMTFVLGFSIDLYTPSFPAIASSLKTTNQLVQLTIPTYFLGYIIGMILLGPISDALGRKKPLLFGLAFYCIMSFLCSFSTSIYMLLLLRLLQGIGVAAVGVMCRAILGDVFTGRGLATAMSYFAMSYRIGPIIAPLIGGYLEVYFGWPSNFYFLMLYGIFILCIIAFFLPETHRELLPFHPKTIFHKYISCFKDRAFFGGALCIGILYSMMIIFNIVGPFFIQDILNYSPISYGHIAFFMGVFAFLGILTNRFFIHFRSPREVILIGMYILVILGFLQVLFAFLFPVNLYSFVVPVIAVLFFSGFIVSNIMSHIIDIIPRGKGTASALIGIIIISCTGILTALSSFLKSDTVIPFAFAYLAMLLSCFLSYQFLFKREEA